MPPVGPLTEYLNQGEIQNAMGVSLNFTPSNNDVALAFQQAGDFVYSTPLLDLEDLLTKDVRIILYSGDADYICNWFGGEAVSLAVNYTHAEAFRAAGYAPFLVDEVEYGVVREQGNFSFVRIYESGHQVPYFQRKAQSLGISCFIWFTNGNLQHLLPIRCLKGRSRGLILPLVQSLTLLIM